MGETKEITPVLVTAIEDQHWYKVEVAGEVHYLPSPTTKLSIIDKPNLDKWRGDVGNREADRRMRESSDRGTRIHRAHQILLLGGSIVYNPWVRPIYSQHEIERIKEERGPLVMVLESADEMYQVAKLQRQHEILQPEIMAVERTVWDLENREAGTLDHAYLLREGKYMVNGREPLSLAGGLYVGDLKTGNYDDELHWWMQVAAYAHMLEKQTELQIVGGLITHIGSKVKTGIPGLSTKFMPRAQLLGRFYRLYRQAAALWEDEHSEDQPRFYDFPSIIKFNGGQNEAGTKTA